MPSTLAPLADALADARSTRLPVMALRPHGVADPVLGGHMDDVVVEDVKMFRAEQMSDGNLWLACYFHNGERVTFSVNALPRKVLHFDTGELPPEWVDFDSGEHRVGEPA